MIYSHFLSPSSTSFPYLLLHTVCILCSFYLAGHNWHCKYDRLLSGPVTRSLWQKIDAEPARGSLLQPEPRRAARIQSEQNPTRKVTHRATAHEQQQRGIRPPAQPTVRRAERYNSTKYADFERSEGFFFMFSARSSGNWADKNEVMTGRFIILKTWWRNGTRNNKMRCSRRAVPNLLFSRLCNLLWPRLWSVTCVFDLLIKRLAQIYNEYLYFVVQIWYNFSQCS